MGPLPKLCMLSAAAAVAVAGFGGPARADVLVTYETLALTNDAAPGTASLFFRGFEAPSINGAGSVAFYGLFGEFDEPVLNTDPGIWTNEPGTISLAVKFGDAAPGTVGLTFTGFGGTRAGIADGGKLTFLGNVNSGNIANDRGIWAGTVGSGFALVAREDDDVPDVDETQPPFNGSQPKFNNNMGALVIGPSGIVSFTSAMTNDVDNGLHENSFFIQPTTTVQALAIAGTQVPGEASNTLYLGALASARVNSLGQTAFAANLKGTAEPTNPAAIFFGPAGDVRVVAAVGRQAPGMSAGITFHSVQHPDLDNEGRVVFVAGLNGFDLDTNPLRGEAIYFGSLGNIAPAAKLGDTIMNIAGLTYAEFATHIGPTINDNGYVTFLSTLTGTGVTATTDSAILAGLAGNPDDLLIVAREGDLPVDFTLLDGPLINNGGQIAFSIQELDGSLSLWMTDLDQNLVRIVGTGDQYTVAPGDIRDVLGLKLGNTIDGYRFLDDDGTVAFALLFEDGTEGVFTATYFIPEPSGAALVLGGIALLLKRRRR